MTDFLTEINQGPLMVPQRVEETGIRRGLLEDVALKVLCLNGEMSLLEVSNYLCLSLGVVDEIFQFFRKEGLCEVPVSYACRTGQDGRKLSWKDGFQGIACTVCYGAMCLMPSFKPRRVGQRVASASASRRNP